MTSSLRTLNLPEELCAAAERLYGPRFASLEQMLIFLLEEITRTDAARLDQEEERIVQERLKELGYL